MIKAVYLLDNENKEITERLIKKSIQSLGSIILINITINYTHVHVYLV